MEHPGVVVILKQTVEAARLEQMQPLLFPDSAVVFHPDKVAGEPGDLRNPLPVVELIKMMVGVFHQEGA
ncbi:hypothetical protein SDC9_209808 [bioreactor metagenome]|uniref:Uncharacterized protein n=1 Tax=bioreactor metagenome TaxID=1076179 RepID=A0A645JFT6_9ZZZZ